MTIVESSRTRLKRGDTNVPQSWMKKVAPNGHLAFVVRSGDGVPEMVRGKTIHKNKKKTIKKPYRSGMQRPIKIYN